VVSRLFKLVGPDRAYFGEKDFQQISVIRRMVEIEGFNIEIVACPIKREADGLALSSRNVRLSAEQRASAPNIHRILAESVADAHSKSVAQVKQEVTDKINAIDGMEVEYYEIVNPADMQPIAAWSDAAGEAVGCVTVYMGDVRLIDNIKYPAK
jgi:pantoate--beta-alanine ligase